METLIKPKISVIIPVRNEEKYIARTIGYLQNQDYLSEDLEIIVVDGLSDDKTASIVEELIKADSRISLYENPRRLSSAARNIGITHARGDIIMFIDGHVYIDNKLLLRRVEELMEAKGVSVLSRPQFLDTPENTFFQKTVSLARKSPIGHGADSTIYTNDEKYVDPTSSGASYKREVFERVGLFDENFDACEDVEFNYRVYKAGFKSYISPALGVFYYPRDNFGSLFKQLARYGRGRRRLAGKHRTTFSVFTLIPPLFVLYLIATIILIITKPAWGTILTYPLVLYLLSLVFISLKLSVQKGLKFAIFLVPVFFIIHFSLGWGFLRESLSVKTERNKTVSPNNQTIDALDRDK